MKKYLLLFAIVAVLASCEKEETPVTEKNSKLTVSVVKEKSLSTGETYNLPLESVINIFQAEGRGFKINNTADLIMGYAWDSIANESVLSYSTAIDNMVTFELPKGKYFIAVINVSDDLPRYAYSYTNIDIVNSLYIEEKIFSQDCGSGQFEKW
jgi:hypothetical protein